MIGKTWSIYFIVVGAWFISSLIFLVKVDVGIKSLKKTLGGNMKTMIDSIFLWFSQWVWGKTLTQ